MQTLREIRAILAELNCKPLRQFGQNFLVDKNLLAKLLALAELDGQQCVLEVGPGTGSLTEELLKVAPRVVAVEIDRRLHRYLQRSLAGADNLELLCGDVLAGKDKLSPAVVSALGSRAVLVANLPYGVAAPLVGQCLLDSHQAISSGQGCRFDRLTFTVQQEMADRMTAEPGGADYGPLSVLVSLLGAVTVGPGVPASAFWPRPKVAGRVLRIDFDPVRAAKIADSAVLRTTVNLAFGQRRKQIGSIVRRKACPFPVAALGAAMDSAGIDRSLRPQQVRPDQYAAMAEALAGGL